MSRAGQDFCLHVHFQSLIQPTGKCVVVRAGSELAHVLFFVVQLFGEKSGVVQRYLTFEMHTIINDVKIGLQEA